MFERGANACAIQDDECSCIMQATGVRALQCESQRKSVAFPGIAGSAAGAASGQELVQWDASTSICIWVSLACQDASGLQQFDGERSRLWLTLNIIGG